MDLNRAQLIGNVTRDPESRTTATGQHVCSFGIATNYSWTDQQGQKQQRAEFHNVVAWGKLAEICAQYLAKGRRVFLEGRLQTRDWEAQDGTKRRTTEIIAENMIMLDRAPATGAPHPVEPTIVPTGPAATEPSSAAALDKGIGDQEIRVEDIPF
jgi:single-strand DNA-binding protein